MQVPGFFIDRTEVTRAAYQRFLVDTGYRPPFVDEPWAEDGWSRLQIGPIAFRGPKLCTRCVMTTVDPDTGERTGGEPLKTLAALHTVDRRVIFGMNLLQDGVGTIRVGDPVSVS